MIEYHGYVTVKDDRIIVLCKDLAFMVDLHVEVSVIFLSCRKGNIFIHVDQVDFISIAYFGLWIGRMNS